MKASNDPLKTILKAILPNDPEGAIEQLKQTQAEVTDKTAVRAEILAYVNKIRIFVKEDWKSRYKKMWEDILDLDVISREVYNPGKQQGTDFNRNLVANIIHFLDAQKLYKNAYNASTMAMALEGDKDHSVRGALGKDPDTAITSRLKRYFE